MDFVNLLFKQLNSVDFVEIEFFCLFYVSRWEDRKYRLGYAQTVIESSIGLLEMLAMSEDVLAWISTFIYSAWPSPVILGSCWTSQRGSEWRTLPFLQYGQLSRYLADLAWCCPWLPFRELKRRPRNRRLPRSLIGELPSFLLFILSLGQLWKLQLRMQMRMYELLASSHS